MDATLDPLIGRIAFDPVPVAAHQLDLQMVQRVEVRKAVLDRPRQRRIVLQAPGLAGDRSHRGLGTLGLGADRRKDALAQAFVFDQFDIARRQAQIALGQHHVDVGQQGAEERPLLVHALQQGQPLRAFSALAEKGFHPQSHAIPAGQRDPALAPRKAPGDGAQVFDRAGGFAVFGAYGRSRADVQLGNLADRRGGEEVVDKAGRAIDQFAVGGATGLADLRGRSHEALGHGRLLRRG